MEEKKVQEGLEKANFDGNLPVLSARGKGIAEAWENSVVTLYNQGAWYSRQGPKDKGRLHVDATMTITIENPDSPRFMHKYVRYGFGDLLEYEMEMLGAKNSLVHDADFDPADDNRWPYHYSERLLKYPGIDGGTVNQLEEMAKGLAEEPHKRRNNIITWVPEKDIPSADPPCLQRIWAYIAPSDDGTFKLNMNYNFRSRNVMIAAPMNMRGLQVIQSFLKDSVIERTGMPLTNGRIVDFIDSYHVSAQDQPILQGFMKRFGKSLAAGETIDDRCFTQEQIDENYAAERKAVEEKVIKMVTNRYEERLRRDPTVRDRFDINAEIEKIRSISARRAR